MKLAKNPHYFIQSISFRRHFMTNSLHKQDIGLICTGQTMSLNPRAPQVFASTLPRLQVFRKAGGSQLLDIGLLRGNTFALPALSRGGTVRERWHFAQETLNWLNWSSVWNYHLIRQNNIVWILRMTRESCFSFMLFNTSWLSSSCARLVHLLASICFDYKPHN